ncbi:MAG: UDP-2,3-diacylglucosamine diphosphatase [Ramlibacter sp.]|nr:UDP-2,3-diacylglucosamine diphosphatase [Ramlibacter sp.]
MSPPTVPRFAELQAPANWRTVDFISDLHLQAAEPATFDAWQRFMRNTPADAVFILGDLFEVWVGDDVLGAGGDAGFEARCAGVLRAASAARPVFFMPGNRDFLVGQALMAHCGATLLDDPCVLDFGGQRWLLTHGDALCLDDHDYLAFRAEVRSPGWQQAFLARPLAERQAVARSLRDASEQRKRAGTAYADVDAAAARAWLQAADARVMVHGHTHRPGAHALGDGLSRVVLSDWEAAAQPPRLEVLRLTPGGLQRLPLA